MTEALATAVKHSGEVASVTVVDNVDTRNDRETPCPNPGGAMHRMASMDHCDNRETKGQQQYIHPASYQMIGVQFRKNAKRTNVRHPKSAAA